MTDLYTLIKKETKRFMRVWKQTLIPPVITASLYLLIFGQFLGGKISEINGAPYINFIFPGLLMMSVIMASYGNTSSSFFGSKFQKSIEELFMSPISPFKILTGFVLAAILRGFFVGILVFLVGIFMAGFQIESIFYTFLFIILSSTLFALLGLLNAIYAKSFDDISVIPSFVITPLIYLGGVFYSISLLPPFWQTISQINPILYMVNGLRFGFIGVSDVNICFAILMLVVFIIIFGYICYILIKKGVGIRN